MSDKTIIEMQKEVDEWANQFEKPYFSPLSRMAALTEEIGELARVFNRMYGDKPKKDTENIRNLEEEIGDILFSLVYTANAENINLSDAWERKLEKVYDRDSNRFAEK